MRVTRLEINRLPGIDSRFTVENVGAGVNVISGPNAIGKSSLLRAMRFLIEATNPGDGPVHLAADLVDQLGQAWSVIRVGQEVQWRRNGQIEPRPSLPDSGQFGSYLLSMETLLAAQGADAAFAAHVGRALRGGFDLSALRRADPFKPEGKSGASENRELARAQQAVSGIEKEYASLEDKRATLDVLRAQLDAARGLANLRQPLQGALELIASKRGLTDAEASMGMFPSDMEVLREDDAERLLALQDARANHHARLRAIDAAIVEHQTAIKQSGLSDPWPNRVLISGHLESVARAQAESARCPDLRKRLTTAKNQLAQAASDLGAETPDVVPQLDPTTVTDADELARKVLDCQARQRELQAKVQPSQDDVADADIERLRVGRDALRSWLSETGGQQGPTAQYIAMGGSACAALAAIAAVIAAAWVAAALAGLALILVLVSLLASPKRSNTSADSREKFGDTGLRGPSAWQPKPVKDLLRNVEDDLAKQMVNKRQSDLNAGFKGDLSRANEELLELQQSQLRLAERIGFDPALSAVGADRFVRLADAYDRSRTDIADLTSQMARIDSAIHNCIASVQAFLKESDSSGVDSLDGLAIALEDLNQRLACATSARKDIETAEADRTREAEAASATEALITGFWARVLLSPTQETELTTRLDQRVQWQQASDTLRDKQKDVARLELGLANNPDLLALALAADEDALAARLALAEGAGQERDELISSMSEIQTQLKSAGTDLKLEDARATVAVDRLKLTEKRDEALTACAAQFLLDDIEKSFRTEHEPAVFTEAASAFGLFTHHAFALEFEPAQTSNASLISARDTRSRERRDLTQLSSATRMQLLLAVRIAWIRQAERDREPMPLFLDEALANSDAQRFNEVVAALEQLVAAEGRQVFYLSARLDDVAMWQAASTLGVTHIDLGEVRGVTERLTSPAQYELPVRNVPAPAGLTPEEYAHALSVPAIDPRLDAGAMHIFHLLRDDLDVLFNLLSIWQSSTVGQLEELIQAPAAVVAIADLQLRRQLAARCAAARAWTEAWRIGRGRPVGRIEIEASGKVSDKFTDRVAELAGQCQGSAAGLVNGLRAGQVPRFRATSTDDLEAWLVAQGYLDEADPLGPDERTRHILAIASDQISADQTAIVLPWLEAGAALGSLDIQTSVTAAANTSG